jgi:glutamate/tyrosine decarboxylase-like PLP-dependent enzyme
MTAEPNSDIPPLDPENWDEFRAFAHRAVDDTIEHVRTIRDSKVWNTMPQHVRDTIMNEAVPRQGIGEDAAYRAFVDLVRPYPSGNLHPRSWGWVRGNGTPLGSIADYLASSLNPNTGGFDQAPVLVERKVVEWFAELMGFPRAAGGILSSGGTMANVLGLNVARNMNAGFDVRADGLQGSHPRLLVYGATETHGWLKKGCELLGLGASAFRRVPVDAEFRIDAGQLNSMIAADRAAGHRPFCVVGTAGTVNTGATDDLVALADICRREALWFHVDGAFGALVALCPEHAHVVAGMERADSLAFDLHKWGYLPFDIACTLIRSDKDLVSTFSVHAPYLQLEERGATANLGFYYADRGIELSRSFKSLKAWMSLRAVGTGAWAAHIARNIAQMQRCAALIEAHPSLELLAPAPLNVVNFRWTRAGVSRETLDDVNREVLLRLQERAIALPSATTLPRGYAIRCANTNHRTTDDDIDALIAGTVTLGDEVWREHGGR